MSSNWPTATIQELIDDEVIFVHKDGNHGSNYPRTAEFGEEGVPFLTAKLLDDSGNIDLDSAPRLSTEKANKFRFGFIEPNDVLLSHNATVGRVAVVPNIKERMLIGTSLTHYRLDASRLLPKYLAAYFSGIPFQNQLASVMSQTTRNQVPITSQRKLSVVVPPIDEQKKIADMLCAFDEKIQNNTQTNQTLEKIAQAMFKSWFVDFDPVKAKMETLAAGGSADDAELAAMGVISANTLDELNNLKASKPDAFNQLAQTAALFPAAMQDSELGGIPVGWKVSKLSSLIKLTGGGTPKRSEEAYWNGDIPWFSVKDVPSQGNVFVVDTDEKISELGLNKSSTKLLPKGTTIITARGTVGKLALVGSDMCMNQSCYGIQGKEVGDFFNYFNMKEAVSTLQRNTHGAVFDTITTQTFETYSMAFSGVELANIFDVLVDPILRKIEVNVRQNIELSTMRDTLLPKLLSGEIDLTSEVIA